MKHQDLETLRQFFGAWFHQDWMLDDPDTDEVLKRFMEVPHSTKELDSIASLIERYGQIPFDDEVLERSLYTVLNCYYLPSADGVPVRSWLQRISERLRAEGSKNAGG